MRIKTHKLAFLFFTLLAYTQWACATENQSPESLIFIGFSNESWHLYSYQPASSHLSQIKTQSEPRTPAPNPQTQKTAYIGADGKLYEIIQASGQYSLLLEPNTAHSYTQPAYNSTGTELYIVELKQGTSVDTDILAIKGGKTIPVVTQRSAQFEPFFHPPNNLYYSNVICTLGCGKIIQEIWRKNLISGEAEQLTLLNSIARQPVVSNNGQWLYFSSNKAGNFHIWRMSLEKVKYEQLTTGPVTDLSPALDRDDNLYFIRHNQEGSCLMLRKKSGELTKIELPGEIEDLRDLEIN